MMSVKLSIVLFIKVESKILKEYLFKCPLSGNLIDVKQNVTKHFVSPSKEDDEKERLSQVKDLQEDNGGDNTEPLEDLFLGLSVEEVRAESNLIRPHWAVCNLISL